MFYLIANWKAHKTKEEALRWMQELTSYVISVPLQEVEIIIAPPFLWLDAVHSAIDGIPGLHTCSQYVSATSEGQFTGEIPASLIAPLARYSLVGHSERRSRGETQEIVLKQFELTKASDSIPILCVRDENDHIPLDTPFIAYEPTASISKPGAVTHPPEREDILRMKNKLSLSRSTRFLYGGSVNSSNLDSLLSVEEIDGLIVGTASLNITEFINIIKTTIQMRSQYKSG